jgi:RNA polymerase sigma factor (TIGR02999 family)
MAERTKDVTRLLVAFRVGDADAEAQLYRAVYDELHRMAARYMRRERPDHTLQATALIHEAYVDLIDQRDKDWQNRAHFYGVAASVMRRILIDHARTRRAGQTRRTQSETIARRGASAGVRAVRRSNRARRSVVAAGAVRSAAEQGRRVAVLRRPLGRRAAQVLGVSSRTVKRDWRLAKTWLYGELKK